MGIKLRLVHDDPLAKKRVAEYVKRMEESSYDSDCRDEGFYRNVNQSHGFHLEPGRTEKDKYVVEVGIRSEHIPRIGEHVQIEIDKIMRQYIVKDVLHSPRLEASFVYTINSTSDDVCVVLHQSSPELEEKQVAADIPEAVEEVKEKIENPEGNSCNSRVEGRVRRSDAELVNYMLRRF